MVQIQYTINDEPVELPGVASAANDDREIVCREVFWDPLRVAGRARWWLWGLLTVFACITLGQAYVYAIFPGDPRLVDFFQDWASARNYFDGIPVYTDHDVSIPRYLGFRARVEVPVNAHPPSSILITLPFGALDYPRALLVWNLLSLASLVATIVLLKQELRLPFSWLGCLPLLTVTICCGPLLQQIYQGQFNLLLLLLFVGIWAAGRSKRLLTAGALVGFATSVKLFPGFIFLYFIVRRQWLAVASGIAALCLLFVATVAVFGVRPYVEYYQEILPTVRTYQNSWPNSSLAGFWDNLFSATGDSFVMFSGDERQIHMRPVNPLWENPGLAKTGSFLSRSAVVLTVAWIIFRSRTRRQLDLAFSVTLVGMLLVSPITWDHYFILLGLPLIVFWRELPKSDVVHGAFVLCVAAMWVPAGWFYVVSVPETGPTSLHILTTLGLQSYALVGTFLLGITLWNYATQVGSKQGCRPTSIPDNVATFDV